MRVLLIACIGYFTSQTPSSTPNDFFKRGTPAMIVGTAGDDHADRAIRAQATMIRDLLFPAARIVEDVSIDVTQGPSAWPANPSLYGGPHVNHVLAKLGTALPLRMEPGKLTIGNEQFEGNEYRLITVVPAQTANQNSPGNPEFLLYAGTSSPGVAEINSVRHGAESILIADAFGKLLTGNWRAKGDGTVIAEFTQPRARRIAWRNVDRELKTNVSPQSLMVHLKFPQQIAAAPDEARVIEACLRGLTQSVEKLGSIRTTDLSVYIYPDAGSISSLTGRRGDGHAVVEARVLHVVRFDPVAGGGFEKLLAHEGMHVLAYESWGAPGTPLWGEGLAVWASGQYGGVSLSDWKRRAQRPIPSITNLLGKSFLQMPENQAYPLAGILVEAAIEKLGVAAVRDHLYGATTSTWDAACKQAKATPQQVEAAFHAALGESSAR